MTTQYHPIKFINGVLELLDQRKLPNEEVIVYNNTLDDCFHSIRDMVVRGAPCIGFTAVYALALWVKNHQDFTLEDFVNACEYLKTARPTAVNLSFEIDRTKELVKSSIENNENVYDKLVNFGDQLLLDSENNNLAMSKFALKELQQKYGDKKLRLMTHCNTGKLACGSSGTALGVIEYTAKMNQVEKVWVDETRPYLQGSRLTSFELTKLGIDHDIVVEGAASYLMKNKLVDAIFVGADRIAVNGDTANKVGTSNLAIIAAHYGVPFYVVAPRSSFDISIESGDEIEIELRPQDEITKYKNYQIAPKSAKAHNPSFDVTDSNLITGIICESAFIYPPFRENILKAMNE